MQHSTCTVTPNNSTNDTVTAIKKNIVFVGGHNSGKKIYLSRLLNSFELEDTNKYSLKIVKNVSYFTMDSESLDDSLISTTYDINIDILPIDDVNSYDFKNTHYVLFFCDGTDESQMIIWFLAQHYLKQNMPCAFFCPYEMNIVSKTINNDFKIVRWHKSTGPYLPTSKYIDIVINLLNSNKKLSNDEITLA